MRDALQPYIGQRITVTGRVQRFGTRPGWNGSKLPTLLVGPVLDAQGVEITDHLWIRIGQRIALADPQPGNVLTLSGTVRAYTKRRKPVGPGPALTERDLGPAYPTRCAVVKAETVEGVQLIGHEENVQLAAQTMPESAGAAVVENVRTCVQAVPARAKVLFALAVLSLEKPEGVSLTELSAKAAVPPTAFLSQLKKMGNAGIVQFTPTGRVLLTNQPAKAMGVAL